jgi:hypothetical protein
VPFSFSLSLANLDLPELLRAQPSFRSRASGCVTPSSLLLRLNRRLINCFALGGEYGLIALLLGQAKRLVAQKFRDPLLFKNKTSISDATLRNAREIEAFPQA